MNDKTQLNFSTDTEENGMPFRLDWRVLLLELRRWGWWIGGSFAVLTIIAYGLLLYGNRNSMERWMATAKLFHQTRSEKIPSFYKQLDTKAIAEFTGSGVQLREVANRLNLGPTVSLVSRLSISIPKSAPNIITITATYNDAKMAAELANKVAEVGVESYVELQNSTIENMLTDRRRRRLTLDADLKKLELLQNAYTAADSSLPPDEELSRLRAEIALKLTELYSTEAEVKRLDVVIAETLKEFNSVEREIRYIHKTHNAAAAELGKMESTLTSLEQKYTGDNPRVRAYQDEVDEKKAIVESMLGEKPAPDEIVYIINQISISLEESLLRNRIEQAGVKARLESVTHVLSQLQSQIAEQLRKLSEYNENRRKIEVTKNALAQLDNSINDMDILLNSAVPDLSIMELSAVPKVPHGGGLKLVIFSVAASGFVVFAVVALLALWSILFGRVKSSREFKLYGEIDDLGALPAVDGGLRDALRLEAALQRTYLNVREQLGSGRVLFVTALSANPMATELTQSWNENFGVSGLQVFRLKCAPYTDRETTVFPAVTKRQSVDDELVCVEKYGSRGWFFANNELVLAPAELELLRNDLKALTEAYDVVILERDKPISGGDTIFEQLSRLADYIVVATWFDVDRKQQLRQLAANEAVKGLRFGGILTGVSKKFWSIQQS